MLGGKEYGIEYVQPSAEESRAYGVYQDAIRALDKHLSQAIAGEHIDLDPPSYLPVREPLPPRVPDLCSDERDLMEYYHPGGVRPENCHCPQCFTQEDSDALDRDFEEDHAEWEKAVAEGREDPNRGAPVEPRNLKNTPRSSV
jgi:hypothetical protein